MDLSNQNEIKIDNGNRIIGEGSAEILEPPGKKVFYNPVQEFNRDLRCTIFCNFCNVLTLQVFLKTANPPFLSVNVLEPLSATGMRSIRFAKEVPNITKIIANDISSAAIENMERNIKHNKVEDIVKTSHSDAVAIMFNNIHPSQRFQVVDLDPYGSPSQFLNSAVQCVCDGGLLMVTCTDMAVLCGNHPETCYTKYGAVVFKGQAIHEMAIRIVLQRIQSEASKYKRYIVPLLSVSVDFYIRVFVKICTSALICKEVTSKLSMFYQCCQCDSTTLQPLGIMKKSEKNIQYSVPSAPAVGTQCEHCGGKFKMGGPIWSAPTHDPTFVNELLKSSKIHEFGTAKRLLGLLSLIQEELHDIPLYYKIPQLCGTIKSAVIPVMKIRSAIINAGYRVSFSHAATNSLKTDAPMSLIWDILREWVKENDVDKKNVTPGSPIDVIRKKEVQNKIDFSINPDANPLSREMGLTRYQQNPMPNWGPGSKSTTMNFLVNPKKLRNQNKKTLARKKFSACDAAAKEPKLENNFETDS